MPGYSGKHMRPREDGDEVFSRPEGGCAQHARSHRASSSLRLTGLLAGMVLVASIAGGTLAWFSQTDGVANLFSSGSVKPQINETFETDYTVKKDVSIQNTGTLSAYLRASVSVYWEDGSGNQLWDAPAAVGESGAGDYSIAWGEIGPDPQTNACWLEGNDGFYYWSQPVDKDCATGILIEKAMQKESPLEKKLVVDIASQALQAEGTAENAFNSVWSESSGLVAGQDGTLTRKGA